MSKDTSGPAFPRRDEQGDGSCIQHFGLSKRECFAGLAMQQMVAVGYAGHDPAKRASAWARDAYIVADAMIAEGNK